jgi:hypothetical protein
VPLRRGSFPRCFDRDGRWCSNGLRCFGLHTLTVSNRLQLRSTLRS